MQLYPINPQSLLTSDSPTFAGLTLTGLTPNYLVGTDASNTLVSVTSSDTPTFINLILTGADISTPNPANLRLSTESTGTISGDIIISTGDTTSSGSVLITTGASLGPFGVSVGSITLNAGPSTGSNFGGSINLLSGTSGTTGGSITLNSNTGSIILNSFTGLLKGTAGVVSVATAGTDYQYGLLTAGRIPFSTGTPATLTDAATLTFDGTNLTCTGTGQFSRLGVGTAPSATRGINCDFTSNTNGSYGAYVNLTTSGTVPFGLIGNVVSTRDGGAPTTISGLNFIPQWTPVALTGNRSITTIGGISGGNMTSPASSTNNMVGTAMTGWTTAFNLTVGAGASGTVSATNLYQFKTAAPLLNNGATIGTQYGFYDIGLTGATTNWGIAINTANNYINGSLMLGTNTAPTASTLTLAPTWNIEKQTNDLTITTAAQKTVVLSPTVYGDLYVGLDASRVSGTSQVTFVGGNIRELVFSNNDTADFPSIELQHDYKEGTNIEAHLHIATRGTNASAYHVRYTIEYTWADKDAVFPATTTLDVETTIAGGTTEFTHKYIDMGAIVGTGKHIGSQLKFLLKKIASASSDAPAANNPYVLQVGYHYQKDTIGSRQEAIK